jgi:hypothetical protein
MKFLIAGRIAVFPYPTERPAIIPPSPIFTAKGIDTPAPNWMT